PRVLAEAQLHVAPEDPARPGPLLQAGGDVDRVAGRQPLFRPGHHLSGVHPRSELQTGAVGIGELGVEVGERFTKLGRGAHRAQRIVLVHRGNAEDGHHGVADELLDRAAVALDDFFRDLEVAGHHPPQALGIDLLPERGRAGDIAEENGDGLARFPRRLGRQRSAARVAEASLLAIFGPAARTNGHGTSLGPAGVFLYPGGPGSTPTCCSTRATSVTAQDSTILPFRPDARRDPRSPSPNPNARPKPLSDVEAREPLGLLFEDLHALDRRASRTLPAEPDTRLDRLGVTLEDGLQGPVGAVARPAGDPAGRCRTRERVPEPDALHAAVHDDPPSQHRGRLRNSRDAG